VAQSGSSGLPRVFLKPVFEFFLNPSIPEKEDLPRSVTRGLDPASDMVESPSRSPPPQGPPDLAKVLLWGIVWSGLCMSSKKVKANTGFQLQTILVNSPSLFLFQGGPFQVPGACWNRGIASPVGYSLFACNFLAHFFIMFHYSPPVFFHSERLKDVLHRRFYIVIVDQYKICIVPLLILFLTIYFSFGGGFWEVSSRP